MMPFLLLADCTTDAGKKGYGLTVCELRESAMKTALMSFSGPSAGDAADHEREQNAAKVHH